MSRVAVEDVNKLKQQNHAKNTKDNKICHNIFAMNQPTNGGSNYDTKISTWDGEQELLID